MLSSTVKFLDHVRASHVRKVRCGLYTPDALGDYQFQGYVGVVDGRLTLDGTRSITRQATLTVSTLDSTLAGPAGQPPARDYLEALTSNSAEITLEWGLRYPDQSEEWIQLARLRVEESSLKATEGGLQINSAYDGGCRVTDFDLVTVYAPYNLAGVKLTYLAAIQDLVTVSYPSAHPPTWIVDAAVDTVSLPPDGTTFNGSRWSAIQSLAAAINVTVRVDHLGRWLMRPATVDRDPVWTVSHGTDGVLVDADTQFSRREQYNAVAIRWELPKGGGGLVYLVDADPASPTYYDGPYGRKPRPEESVSTITTEAQAIAHAGTVLAQYKGKTRGITLDALHMPLLEPGDVLAVFLPDGSAERHVIDTITLPLDRGVMSLQTRILRGGITYNEPGVLYDDVRYTYAGQGV